MYIKGSDSCHALDLRKSSWEWDDSLIPKLPVELGIFALEYVPFNQKLYMIGGAEDFWSYSGPAYLKKTVCIFVDERSQGNFLYIITSNFNLP